MVPAAMDSELSDDPPLTPFQLFSLEMRQKKANWSSRLSPLEIARKVAQAWFELSPATRRIYYDKAGLPHRRSIGSNEVDVMDRSSAGVEVSGYRECRNRPRTNDDLISRQSSARQYYMIDSLGRRRPTTRPPANGDSRSSSSRPNHSQRMPTRNRR
jgi:hypothetical protein